MIFPAAVRIVGFCFILIIIFQELVCDEKVFVIDNLKDNLEKKFEVICKRDISIKSKKGEISKLIGETLKKLNSLKRKAVQKHKWAEVNKIKALIKILKNKTTPAPWILKYYKIIEKQSKMPLSIDGHLLTYDNYWAMPLVDRKKTVQKYTFKNKFGLYEFQGDHYIIHSDKNGAFSLEKVLLLDLFEKNTQSITKFRFNQKVSIFMISSSKKMDEFTLKNFNYKLTSPGVYFSVKDSIFIKSFSYKDNSVLFHEVGHFLTLNGVIDKIRFSWLSEGYANMLGGWMIDCDAETNLYFDYYFSIRRRHNTLKGVEKKYTYEFCDKIISSTTYKTGEISLSRRYSLFWSLLKSLHEKPLLLAEVIKKSKRYKKDGFWVFPQLENSLKKKVFSNWKKNVIANEIEDTMVLGLLCKELENIYFDVPYENNKKRTPKKYRIFPSFKVHSIERVINKIKPKLNEKLIYKVVYGIHLFCQKRYNEALATFLELKKDYYRLSLIFPLIGKCYQVKGDEINAKIYYDKALVINPHNRMVKKFRH